MNSFVKYFNISKEAVGYHRPTIFIDFSLLLRLEDHHIQLFFFPSFVDLTTGLSKASIATENINKSKNGKHQSEHRVCLERIVL